MINVYRQHAIKRMFERGVTDADVQKALMKGKVIEDYPNDYPLPSRLWLGRFNGKPLHIVFADNVTKGERVIITVYEPDPTQWNADFTARAEP